MLYWKVRYGAYYVLMVQQRGPPRCIGVPSHAHGMEKLQLPGQRHLMAPTNMTPSIVFRGCLYWEPDRLRHDSRILVFDTVVESFRFMRPPAGATTFSTHLFHMEGLIGFSSFADGRTGAKIWVMEDYEREIWSLKYHVQFPVVSLCDLTNIHHLVLSHRGDMLVYNRFKCHMFHCDSSGKLIEEFQWDSESHIGQFFRESLVQHEFFPRQPVRQPSFFGRL